MDIGSRIENLNLYRKATDKEITEFFKRCEKSISENKVYKPRLLISLRSCGYMINTTTGKLEKVENQ